jgi:glycosyltransferase involved in cell wall biosynthesis
MNLAEGFRRNGIVADFYSAEQSLHPYDYPDGSTPLRCPKSSNRLMNKLLIAMFLIKLLVRYKYFIFLQAGWTLMKDQKDITLLRFFGKKTLMMFVGCDARVPETVAQFHWNPCTGCPDEYKHFVNCNIQAKRELIPNLETKFDFIASPEECAGLLKEPYFNIHYPRCIDHYLPVYPQKDSRGRIRILHAPSHTHYKGTKYIREAIEKLGRLYENFEYIEKQGLPVKELHKVIASCDLVIDQVLVGYYGLLAVESMAFGKPVMVFIRPDIWELEKNYSPVYNADPDNIYESLEKILLDPSQLEQKGKDSRAYVEKFHDSVGVAIKLYSMMKSK